MRSRTTDQFRTQLSRLPEDVQRQARSAYQRFKRDPWQNGLRFKPVHPSQPLYSVRIARGYRAVGKRDAEGVLWFWIGSHADYEKLLTQS